MRKDSKRIKNGVRQGETISPKVFISCVEKIFRNIDWIKKGIHSNGEKLNHLQFADGIIIITHAVEDIEVMLQELDNANRKCGLKTKIMAGTARTTKAIYVNGLQLEVEEYVYLGRRFTLIEKNQDNEIRRRIKAVWQAFGRHSTIMKDTLPTCLKRKVFNQCILPAVTYRAETWTIVQHHI